MIGYKYKLDINGKTISSMIYSSNRESAVLAITKICESMGGSFLDIIYCEP